MDEYRQFSAKTTGEAIMQACIELGTTSDQLDIQVISEGSSGFFGIGSRPAVIKVRKISISTEEMDIKNIIESVSLESVKSGKKDNSQKKEKNKQEKSRQGNVKQEKQNQEKPGQDKPKQDKQKQEKPKQDKPDQVQTSEKEIKKQENPVTAESVEAVEVTEEEIPAVEKAAETKVQEQSSKPKRDRRRKQKEKKEIKEQDEAPVEKPEDPQEKKSRSSRPVEIITDEQEIKEIEARAIAFLKDVFDSMEFGEVEINSSYNKEDGSLEVNFEGEDMGILIGKRGQTLDSLQYLTSLVVNKNREKYVRVKLDTEDYRRRRKETLENLAKGIANNVRKSRKSIVLEPMNPYERRIIHSVLQNNRFVETVSEGEEPYRHIVVKYKRY